MCAQENLVAWSSPLATLSGQQSSGKKPRSKEDKWALGSLICLVILTANLWSRCHSVSQDAHKEARCQKADGSSRTELIFLSSTDSPTTRAVGGRRWDGKGKVICLYLCGARKTIWDPQLHEKCQFGDHLTEWNGWISKEAFTTPTFSKWFFFSRTTKEIFLGSLSLILSQG